MNIFRNLAGPRYIEKSEKGGAYHIGVKLVEIASNHINNLELQTEARPFLNDLHMA